MTTKVVANDYHFLNCCVKILSVLEEKEMKTTLQKNIDKYMDLKGLKYYSDLLYEIGKLMGKTKLEARAFVEKEKSNFSKTLKGERPLKYDYIIPLEKLFGVPLAKMLEEQVYFESINKDDIPYLKSFRYYAYKDEPELYDELDKTATVDGNDIIDNSDEYNRFFFDYLIEYKSYNGLRHMVNKHHFHLNPVNPVFYQTDENSFVCGTLPIQLAKFVIDSNDPDIFNKVYDPFEYLMRFSYRDMGCLYTEEQFVEAVVNNKKIFDSLFAERQYPFEFINKGVEPKDGNKPSIRCINPLLNVCLDYCLRDLNQYKNQAEIILKFGIKYNQSVLDNLAIPLNECHLDNVGNLFIGWRCYYANLIYTDIDKTEDDSINKLINQLPKLNKGD